MINWEGFVRKGSWPILRYLRLFLGVRRITKIISQDNRFPGRDSNPRPLYRKKRVKHFAATTCLAIYGCGKIFQNIVRS
jgi:hypothetical protein